MAANAAGMPISIPTTPWPECLPEHHPDHHRTVRAQSHANAYFAGTALNRVGHQAIKSHAGKHECEQPKAHRQNGHDALLVQHAADVVGQRVDAHRKARVDFGQRLPDLSGNGSRIAGRPDLDRS